MLPTRSLSLVVMSLVLLAACTPAAAPSPTAAPAKPAATTAPAAKAADAKPAATTAPAAKPAATAAPAAKPAIDYYAGKTVTLIAASSPGGGTDTIVRLIARHLPNFIPGKPNMIVQNVDGAGGITALNQVVNNAKPDGLTLNGSVTQTLLYSQLQGVEQVRYDLRKVTWIGNFVDDTQVFWLRSDTPYTNLESVLKAATPPKVGTQSGAHPSTVYPKIAQEVTGMKLNLITGYPGSPEIFLDVERGALDGRFASFGSLKTQRPEWLENKFVRILLYTGAQRHPDLPDVPSITEFIPKDSKALLALVFGPQAASRAMAGPPGLPADVTKVLQDGFAKMAVDKAFLADLEKTGFDGAYTTPSDILANVNNLLGDQEVVSTLKRILAN